MATADKTKHKVFDYCFETYQKYGKAFTTSQVEKIAGGTNKQTLLKYYQQFKELVPSIEAMPDCNYGIWQAMQTLNAANKTLSEDISEPLLEKIENLEKDKIEIHKKNDALTTQIEALKDTIKGKDDDKKQLAREISMLKEAMNSMTTHHSHDLKLQALEHEKIVDLKNNKLQSATNEQVRLSQQIKQEQTQASEDRSHLQEQLRQIEKTNKEKISALIAKENEHKKSLEEQTRQSDKLAIQLDMATEKAKEVKIDQQTTREKNRNLKKNIHDIELQLAKHKEQYNLLVEKDQRFASCPLI